MRAKVLRLSLWKELQLLLRNTIWQTILTYSLPRQLVLIHVQGLVQYLLHSEHLNFPYIFTGSLFLERPFERFLELVFFDAIVLEIV